MSPVRRNGPLRKSRALLPQANAHGRHVTPDRARIRSLVGNTIAIKKFFTGVDDLTVQEWFQSLDGAKRHLRGQLLWIIALRAAILLLGINLASPLGILPSEIGPFPSAALWSIVTVALTSIYLGLWWSGKLLRAQLYLQISGDLLLTTVLVAQTHGVASTFVSFYLLIIICCSMTLGRNGGMGGAALSAILYSGTIGAQYANSLASGVPGPAPSTLAFQLGIHALGFFAVAFLGGTLSQRIKVVQKELQESTDSLNQLRRLNELVVSSIRSGLATTDLQGRLLSYNTAAEDLTQRKFSQVLGLPIGEVMGADLWDLVSGADFSQDARPLRHENRVLLPNGSMRYLGYSVSPLQDERRQRLGYIVSFQDLTEIKRLEEEVRLKERMAAVGQMAAGIAHEIRNPLTSMRGSAEILGSRLNLPESERRLMDILLRESDRLNKFVEDFLNFARPRDSARQRIDIDLAGLLRDSVTLLRNSPEVKGKHAVLMSASEQEIRILANPDQLKQVFWNLTQNALRAMPHGGTLTIIARQSSDGGTTVVFRDEGVGITGEEKGRLFQPFQAGFAGGTGLGLSIVYQIVKDHGGRIEVESERGKGTSFILYFPSTLGTSDRIKEVTSDACGSACR
jgi:two-component system sensor histidine kinase PilS (NtrC family)